MEEDISAERKKDDEKANSLQKHYENQVITITRLNVSIKV